MKIISLLLFVSFYHNGIAQNSYNYLACKDFTYQNKKCEDCSNLRNIFEIVISEPQFHFKVVEREKLDKIFETVKEEDNLRKDLSDVVNKKLELAGVDFLVIGNLDYNIASGYQLFITFIKVSGKDFTVAPSFMVNFTKEQSSDNGQLIKIFEKDADDFVKSHFLSRNAGDSSMGITDLYKELNRKDSIKEKEIQDIKDYSNMARLNLYGLEFDEGDILFSSGISVLMKNVWGYSQGKGYTLKVSDSALHYSDTVIERFPKFPFGYASKAMLLSAINYPESLKFAQKAVEILKITTTIEGHNPIHDEILRRLLLFYKMN